MPPTRTALMDRNLMRSEELPGALEKLNYIDDEWQLLGYAETILPNWIVHRCDHYAPEYQVLEQNWYRLCAQWKTVPRQILVVDYLPQSQEEFANYQVLLCFCNKLTHMGYVIRNKADLVPCQTCRRLLLSEKVYRLLKPHNTAGLPERWSPLCEDCIATTTAPSLLSAEYHA